MIQLTSLLKHWKLIAIVLLSLSVFWLYRAKTELKQDRNRISENFEQKDRQVSQMNLTLDEFKRLETKDRTKIDSLLKVSKIKPKHIKQATVVNTDYRDTTITETVYLPAIQRPDRSFVIPITSGNSCWGMKGRILSTDENSKFEITEKTANNSAQILVTKKRGFWWWKKPERIQAFGDCGEIDVTHINFVKK